MKRLESVLTIVGGRIVYEAGEFSKLAPPALPVSPDWSPVRQYGGYASQGASSKGEQASERVATEARGRTHACGRDANRWVWGESGPWSLSCDCFAF